ncbi:unnamed protein product [Knipowitschia caucasica]|uniref:Transcription factor IIIB 50 kDa subunit n=1 Tax=Knipowitschia caucasica TaxID=637954 RepID=A0AAV2IZA5_KNICA
MSGLKCPQCGSVDVVEDDLYGQSQSVCVDCGSVVREGSLAPDPVGGTDVSYSFSTQKSKRPCPNLIKGLQRARSLCRVLRVNSDIETLTLSYFERAYVHERFLCVSLEKKEVLAGCCLLASCRTHGWPVTMATVAFLLETDAAAMGSVYQDALRILNVQVPAANICDIIEAHCQQYRLSPEHVPSELAVDLRALTRRTVALVELAAESWIVTGRRPAPLLTAAMYLSWQSLHPSPLRLKTGLGKFCQIGGVPKSKYALMRVTELREMLCKLGNAIPWEKQEVTPDNVMPQVEDILDHRFALMRKALRSFEESLQTEAEKAPDPEGDQRDSPLEREVRDTAEDPGLSPSERSEAGADWGKGVLFAPPCVGRPRKRKRTPSSRTDVTGDEDISDSEIDSYIRTPREVRDFVAAQKLISTEKDNV